MAAVNHLAAYAKAHDVHRLRLETGIHQHAAIRLYEREGFSFSEGSNLARVGLETCLPCAPLGLSQPAGLRRVCLGCRHVSSMKVRASALEVGLCVGGRSRDIGVPHFEYFVPPLLVREEAVGTPMRVKVGGL